MTIEFSRKAMNTREAAAYLADLGTPYTPGTLAVWRSKGRGPRYRKISRRVFYMPADLENFASGQVVETIDSNQAA